MTAELWTPGAPSKGRGLQLWIPESAREKFYACTLCKKRFPESQKQQWARHVGACAKRHDDEIQADIAERRADPILSPMDRERADYLRRNPRNRGRKSRHLKGIVG